MHPTATCDVCHKRIGRRWRPGFYVPLANVQLHYRCAGAWRTALLMDAVSRTARAAARAG